jgi:hypothetical protein
MAQGGGKDLAKLEAAIGTATTILKQQ